MTSPFGDPQKTPLGYQEIRHDIRKTDDNPRNVKYYVFCRSVAKSLFSIVWLNLNQENRRRPILRWGPRLCHHYHRLIGCQHGGWK